MYWLSGHEGEGCRCQYSRDDHNLFFHLCNQSPLSDLLYEIHKSKMLVMMWAMMWLMMWVMRWVMRRKTLHSWVEYNQTHFLRHDIPPNDIKDSRIWIWNSTTDHLSIQSIRLLDFTGYCSFSLRASSNLSSNTSIGLIKLRTNWKILEI